MELRYKDVCQFGIMYLFVVGEEFVFKFLLKFGFELLDLVFIVVVFCEVVGKWIIKIKVVLLNQVYVVGIGNIYVDEVFFCVGIYFEIIVKMLIEV